MKTAKRNIYEIGYSSPGPYKKTVNGKETKAYQNWKNMLKRCYSPEYLNRNPSYRDCIVSDEWQDFQNFAKWHEDNYIEDYQLDKDLLVKNNKLYSPDNCLYIPPSINYFLCASGNSRGKYLQGVYVHKNSPNKFQANINVKGSNKYLGSFDTEKDAYICYKEAKEELARHLAKEWQSKCCKRTYQALLDWKL